MKPMNKTVTDKESTEGGSAEPEFPSVTPAPRPIRSAFEDKSPSITLRKRRRLGEGRPVTEKMPKPTTSCRVCGGAHPSRMCDVGR